MRRVESALWVMGVAAVFALGVVVAPVLVGNGVTEDECPINPGPGDDAVDQRLSEVVARLDDAAAELALLVASINQPRAPVGADVRLPVGSGDAGGERGREAEGAAGPTGGTSFGDVSVWLRYVDEDVGRVLVERGMTPYDPGVADALLDACNKLRDVERAFGEATARYRVDLENRRLSARDFVECCKPHEEKRRVGRSAIVESLAAALDTLR